MTHLRNTSILAAGVLCAAFGSACRDGARASARADDDRARARAMAGHDYDGQNETTTGVYIDPKIANACGVQTPNTFFAFDSADIRPEVRDTLDKVADCLEKGALRGNEVVLVGHADPRGSDTYNEELGMSRAEAVASFLRRSGVPKTRIETESSGERNASRDASGWPQDRRVDIVLDPDNKRPRKR